MQFKNAIIYAIQQVNDLTHDKVAEKVFTECRPDQVSSSGFVNPVTGLTEGELVFTANGYSMVSLRIDEKIIPGGAVKKMVADRVREIQDAENRKVARKEKDTIKEEIIFDLIPRAMIKTSVISAYLDHRNGWMVVDASAAKKAETLVSFLRSTLGSLPAVPLQSAETPSLVMTQWMLNSFPEEVTPLDAVSISTDEDGGAARFKKTNLLLPQVVEHLNNGGTVAQIDLSWKDTVSFSLAQNLYLKKIKLLDSALNDKGESETAAERFDADFALFTGVMAEFLPVMLGWFGGKYKD